jgi:hypothetical protein
MPKPEHKVRDKLRTSLAQALSLCQASTGRSRYLTVQVFFMPGLSTAFGQLARWFTQPRSRFLNLLAYEFSPLFTGPITNTKLIKE